MKLFKRTPPVEKEYHSLLKQEAALLKKAETAKESNLSLFLNDKVPPNLQRTLDKTFSKAFYFIFEKGTTVIEKTYNRSKIEEDFRIKDFIAQRKNNRKSLKAISKAAAAKGRGNFVLSGISGVGLGALGIGIPDIVLFTSLILKNLYETALNYGYDYNNREEKQFILLLIQASVSTGDEFKNLNSKADRFIQQNCFDSIDISASIENTAAALSKELLYVKFIQGIPLVGAVGGAYNMIYMNKISKYA